MHHFKMRSCSAATAVQNATIRSCRRIISQGLPETSSVFSTADAEAFNRALVTDIDPIVAITTATTDRDSAASPETVTDGNGNNGAPPPDSGDSWWGDGSSNDPSSGNAWGILSLTFLSRGVRGRLAADPFFAHKLLVECCLDAAIIVGVNYNTRKDRFLPEIEFTLCQMAISLLSDFALVYLLAPSTLRSPATTGSLRARIASLPTHVFQSAAPGTKSFTPSARFLTFLLKGVQYGIVGFAMGCLGAGSVQALLWVREHLDPYFEPPATVQSIRGTGVGWSIFMATSSNLRYNMVTGLEDVLYWRSVRAGKLGSVAVRLVNNWAGAIQWVMVTGYLDLNRPWKAMVLRQDPEDGNGEKRRYAMARS